MKPIIGVIPLWDDEKDSIWMLPGYMDGISEAGGLPIIFPFTSDSQNIDQLFGLCDGILLTEAVYMPGKRFLWAVQWHPEFSYKTDENSRKILRAFVEAAERS